MVHHVITRFADKEWLVTDDVSRDRYLWLLGRALDRSDWRCLAFAVMSNHIHLAMRAGESRAELWLRRVHPPFARWLNQRLDRIGPVIASRPDMWTVQQQDVADLIAYIHNNPVRGGVARTARESTWTSHRAYVGEAPKPRWLAVEVTTSPENFDEYVRSTVRMPGSPEFAELRRRVRQRGPIEVATPTIGEGWHADLLMRPFTHLRPDPDRVLEVASEVTGVSVKDLPRRNAGHNVTRTRAIAIAAASTLGVSASKMGSALGISPQRASYLRVHVLQPDDAPAVGIVRARLSAELGNRTCR